MTNNVNVWVSPDGETLKIPDEVFSQTKFTKSGWPDKRVKGNAAFWDWVNSCKECGRKEGEGHYDDCSVGMGVLPPNKEMMADVVAEVSAAMPAPYAVAPDAAKAFAAQAYAERVWKGQSSDIPRAERLERVRKALEGQNLPFDRVVL